MELWVRDQSREVLLKCNQIYYFELNDKHIIATDLELVARDYDYQPLGYYKTKERALEVLDEIQKILKPSLIFNNADISSLGGQDLRMPEDSIVLATSNDKCNIEHSGTYVYEMPKE